MRSSSLLIPSPHPPVFAPCRSRSQVQAQPPAQPGTAQPLCALRAADGRQRHRAATPQHCPSRANAATAAPRLATATVSGALLPRACAARSARCLETVAWARYSLAAVGVGALCAHSHAALSAPAGGIRRALYLLQPSPRPARPPQVSSAAGGRRAGEGARSLGQPDVRQEGGARQHVCPPGHTDELYLEEISDRIIEVDVECQTDAFLDRPPTPFFVPAKTGRDVATQIEEGELFDFDVEVKPILEVLVGKTIEQALLEVMEEEELADLWAHQHAYAELRNAELAEVQRLEEQDRRYREEKERCKQQQMQMLQKEKETIEKIAAQAFAKRYLADLIPSVFNNLHESGFFYDPIERDIETEFLPWLMTEVEETLEKKTLGRVMLDSLIRTVTEKRLDVFSQKPLPVQIEAPAEEPRPIDNAPQVAAGTEDADQPVRADKETDQPAAEEQPSRHITFQIEEADQETDVSEAD
ncbi:radial spoke head protein 3 homolog isoform X1 [Numida meleagris]|uniref:radial spoke head protein 3 homolog isoform X1 n=1 Tax=Numida meleagris TaxID=8996 RepID=UPI000B3DDF4E|nr:radial spoke head protein 3 homolog isoform X1 [Numida meleagris]